jgi:hypothetical protein
MTRNLTLAELGMDGLAHAPFNAALLHTAVLAFPEAKVSFRAFHDHVAAVRDVLGEHAPEILTRVRWCELPPPRTSMLARWRFFAREFATLRATGDRLLLCSASRMMLMQLRRSVRPGDEVRAVLHGDLDQLERPGKDRFPASVMSLRRVLRHKLPPELRLIVLGASIRSCIPAAFEPAFANACVIDHPYHFGALQPRPEGPASFGVFGNAGDGEEFATVARRVRQQAPEVSLSLIGFVGSESARALLSPLVAGVGTVPLPREEFLARTARIGYALWLAQPGGYRLRASGTFFDALSFGKPLLFVANAFVDRYFEQEPAIGVRCASLEELAEAAVAVTRTQQGYAEAQAAIARLRERFTPQAQAAALAACFQDASVR